MSTISNNSINNKTFIYHLANTFRGSEFLCKIILFLFVHNIHKAIAVIGDTTLNPTVRKYYADHLLERELVGINRYARKIKGGGREFPKGLLEKIQNIATTITSSGNTLIKDWLIEDYRQYRRIKARYMGNERERARSCAYYALYMYPDSYVLHQRQKIVDEHLSAEDEDYPKYRPNIVLERILRQKDFLNPLVNDRSLRKNLRNRLKDLI